MGLSAENPERLFDAFYTPQWQGSGRGLAITCSPVLLSTPIAAGGEPPETPARRDFSLHPARGPFAMLDAEADRLCRAERYVQRLHRAANHFSQMLLNFPFVKCASPGSTSILLPGW